MQISTFNIRPFLSTVWIVLILLAFTDVSSAREKKDVLVFANGDGTVSIDWSKVVRIESPQIFVIADEKGDRFTGELKSASADMTAKGLRVEVHDSSTNTIVPAKE